MLSYRNIVVGTDFSPLAEVGVQAALELAASQGARRVHLVHVVQTSTPVLPALVSEGRPLEISTRAERVALERLQAVPLGKTMARVTHEVRVGSPAKELAAVADEQKADLVVIASHSGNALTRLVLGSAAGNLIRVAHCPVLVVNGPTEAPGKFRRVVAAIDLSPVSQPVLANAFNIAYASGASVRVVSFCEVPLLSGTGDLGVPSPTKAEELEQLHQAHKEEIGRLLRRVPRGCVEVEVDVVHRGPAPQAILEAARQLEADLLVLGTSGRNAWHRMILGSTTHHVLSKSPCPVLVVPLEVKEQVPDLARTPALETGG